jgi:hypothetical protein
MWWWPWNVVTVPTFQSLTARTWWFIKVTIGRRFTDWVPLQEERAGLQLFILIDDAASISLGSQLEDIRQFVNAQPSTTAIGVAYMRNGTAEILENPTSDHMQAAKALRLQLGDPGASTSPYFSLVDLIERWPEGPVRREILMVSYGIDRFGASGPSNPYVDSAIEEAQRAGVIVYSIYTPGVGHYGHSFWRMNWGQNYLSQISDETENPTTWVSGLQSRSLPIWMI